MASPPKTRKAIKTYSRNRKHAVHDEEPAPKRRRVESTTAPAPAKAAPPKHSIENYFFKIQRPPPALFSSPKSSPDIFSDEVAIPSTPPSSPPKATSPVLQARKPLFSFLGKKAAHTKQPLGETSHNVQTAAPQTEIPAAKKKRLAQMQIDLGGETSKSCNVCGMNYIPSNAEDAILHRKYHAMNTGGVDLRKSSMETLKKRKVWAGDDGSFIAVIHRKDTLAFRNKATQVLEVVNTELGAVTIEDEKLWSQVIDTSESSKESDDESTEVEKRARSSSDRFKVYLYIRGQKCIGACLAERIQKAYAVLAPEDPIEELLSDSSSPISISQTADNAMLGISRIWTSNMHRKAGIATALLDSATSDFLYGMWVPKDLVAFSQPTDSGGQLARKWFGVQAGWHVYVE